MSVSDIAFYPTHKWTSFHEPNSYITHIVFSQDGGLLASAGTDGDIIIFRTNGTPLLVLHLLPRIKPTAVIWASGSELIVASSDGVVCMMEFFERHQVRQAHDLKSYCAPADVPSIGLVRTL